MKAQELWTEIEVKEQTLKDLEQEIISLKRDAWRIWLDENPNLSVVEKFEKWLSEGPKTLNEPWITHILSSNKKDLFEYDVIIYMNRHETIKIDRIGENLIETYETLSDYLQDKDNDALQADYYYSHLKKNEITLQDLEDWMVQLMESEFNSMVNDW